MVKCLNIGKNIGKPIYRYNSCCFYCKFYWFIFVKMLPGFFPYFFFCSIVTVFFSVEFWQPQLLFFTVHFIDFFLFNCYCILWVHFFCSIVTVFFSVGFWRPQLLFCTVNFTDFFFVKLLPYFFFFIVTVFFWVEFWRPQLLFSTVNCMDFFC